ncbi:MAG: manganese efflux pump MntP family protein [Melioribacteraceae bacterium]|jgi:putative Mn2+ efflux pump MntP|nr:manganese efflux pump MntP family protein [Melioribacteraceae bacterium]
MDIVEIIIIAIGLSMDAAAVSLVAASAGYADNLRAKFRLSFHFGLFQFLMPILGWFMGSKFVTYLVDFDHWIAFVLLGFVGGRMIMSGFESAEEKHTKDPSKGITLILLSVATSIDALAIGLSLAMLDVNIWYPSIIIGIITASLSLVFIQVGKKLSATFGKKTEIVGGIILIAIGVKILISHMF